jgi:sRNA-binding carbon storage regulator CsrA
VDKGMESLNKHGRLILGFGLDESVEVGGCLVTLVAIKGNRIKLAFQAPQEVKITRTNAKRKEPRNVQEDR